MGVITSWNPDVLTVTDTHHSVHCLTVTLNSTASNYSFTITNVYAPADHRDSAVFLSEFESTAPPQSSNWVAIGDFNLTRSPADKNTHGFNSSLATSFNNLINDLALHEFPLLNRLYTWSNKREIPTLARLDSAFFNNAFATTFPNSSLCSRAGNTSDHIPIILSVPTAIPKSHRFRFENA